MINIFVFDEKLEKQIQRVVFGLFINGKVFQDECNEVRELESRNDCHSIGRFCTLQTVLEKRWLCSSPNLSQKPNLELSSVSIDISQASPHSPAANKISIEIVRVAWIDAEVVSNHKASVKS